MVLFAVPAWGGEITTNGTGGGAWSDTATWRGGVVPKADDEVTIRKGDTVVFDRNDDCTTLQTLGASSVGMLAAPFAQGPGLLTAACYPSRFDGKATCAKLNIDPRGALTFKKGAGKLVFSVPGVVENFGVIKLDGTASADDHHELRLTAKTLAERVVKCEKGGAFIAIGKANLPGDRRNVRLLARAADTSGIDLTGNIEVKGGTLDVQRVELRDMKLTGHDLDNTGAKVGERCHIVDNRFLERCNVMLHGCDTPTIANNLFDYSGNPWHQPAAVYLNGCPLAEVKKNTVKGYFYYALSVYGCTDAVVSGNTTEKCHVGAYCVGTASFRGNTFREAGTGFIVTSMTGTIDACVFDKTLSGVHLAGATVQMADCVAVNAPKEFKAVDFSAGEVTLINCDFGPDKINLPKMLPKTDKPLVTALNFFILKVNGELPEDSQVDARTTNPTPPLAPGAQDLNVRNVPAALVGGRSPLPQSLSPILLRSWVIEKDGKTTPAPDYTVRILAPAEGDKPAKVLKTFNVKPEAKWYRPKPDDPAPTLEVNLK